jgi:predicted XRE-type DNA-binding protein
LKSVNNPFKNMGFDSVTEKNLYFKSTLMSIIVRHIQDNKISQRRAATFFNISQPRVSDLMSGKIDLFSSDTLLNMIEKIKFGFYGYLLSSIGNYQFGFLEPDFEEVEP